MTAFGIADFPAEWLALRRKRPIGENGRERPLWTLSAWKLHVDWRILRYSTFREFESAVCKLVR